jgi:hypothetical protein
MPSKAASMATLGRGRATCAPRSDVSWGAAMSYIHCSCKCPCVARCGMSLRAARCALCTLGHLFQHGTNTQLSP